MSADPRLPAILLILLAPFIGSFLGVLVDRLPRGEDVMRRRSACRSCAAPLGVGDLIPILSFALSRGRCRHCAAELAPWHLYIEITALGAAVCVVAAGGAGWSVWLQAIFLWLLIALFFADLLWMRLPDPLTMALFAAAMMLAVGGIGLLAALYGAALGSGSFLLLRLGYRFLRGREGLGLGDVKLMAGLGAFAGPGGLALLVLVASGGALAWVAARQWFHGRGAVRGDMRLPFGAALCAAGGALWVARAAGLPLP
ncbi:prepilin peptidase [Tropicibacter oceani]|uniref:Prepilin leader peptidase/N-methyltransferase n=1 Tax=Tropicibacter oceani TaxID=3058420 RepID=A0ABY8QMN1_9RHOB|nr:A24 family peptidase [Tropicibacter oceani]WGW05909.1 prepilin peptidase [Tropicibacter oceani]